MRRVRFSAAMSLDGYIAEMFKDFDTILMGRKSYEAAKAQENVGMPGMAVVVFSSTLRQEDCGGVTVVDALRLIILGTVPGVDERIYADRTSAGYHDAHAGLTLTGRIVATDSVNGVESYRLVVGSSGVELTAPAASGRFYKDCSRCSSSWTPAASPWSPSRTRRVSRTAASTSTSGGTSNRSPSSSAAST